MSAKMHFYFIIKFRRRDLTICIQWLINVLPTVVGCTPIFQSQEPLVGNLDVVVRRGYLQQVECQKLCRVEQACIGYNHNAVEGTCYHSTNPDLLGVRTQSSNTTYYPQSLDCSAVSGTGR